MKYEPAAKPMKPSGRCQPGARALLDLMLYLTPGLISSGCYNARKIVGSSDVSLHAEGRAIDVAMSPDLAAKLAQALMGGKGGER